MGPGQGGGILDDARHDDGHRPVRVRHQVAGRGARYRARRHAVGGADLPAARPRRIQDRHLEEPGVTAPRTMTPGRWADLLVGMAIGVELVHGWYTRHAFNPDGVSYLDLAGRLRAGDFASFVQGYWSPAFPFLVAAGSVATGGAPLAMLFVAHALSVVAAVAAILLIRRWGEAQGRPWFTAAGVLAFLLVSDGIPK